MKKFLSLLLAMLIVLAMLALTACNSEEVSNNNMADSRTDLQSEAIPPANTDFPHDPLSKFSEYLDISKSEKLSDLTAIWKKLEGVWFDTTSLDPERAASTPFIQFTTEGTEQIINVGDQHDFISYDIYKILEGYKIKDSIYHFVLEFVKSTGSDNYKKSDGVPVMAVDFSADTVDKITILPAYNAYPEITDYCYYGSDIEKSLLAITEPYKEFITESPDGTFKLYSIGEEGGGEGWSFTLVAENTRTEKTFIFGKIPGLVYNIMDRHAFWNSKNELCYIFGNYRVINLEEKRTYYPIKDFDPNVSQNGQFHDYCIYMAYDEVDKQLISQTIEFDKVKNEYFVFVEIYSEDGTLLKRFDTGVFMYEYKHTGYAGAEMTVDENTNTIYLDAANNPETPGKFSFKY